jgi:hypothetical protein
MPANMTYQPYMCINPLLLQHLLKLLLEQWAKDTASLVPAAVPAD